MNSPNLNSLKNPAVNLATLEIWHKEYIFARPVLIESTTEIVAAFAAVKL